MAATRGTAAIGILLLVTVFGLSPKGGLCQTNEQPACTLIRSLVQGHQKPGERTWFSCGLTREDQKDIATAKSLVEMGASAIPCLEKALDSIEKQGEESEFAAAGGLLPEAYARIQGLDAYARLRRLIGNPRLKYMSIGCERSVAISLGLTSYVPTFRPAVKVSACRAEEPRDPLDRLIVAWEMGDRELLEGSLGPNAKTALGALLEHRSWRDLRAELWHGSFSADMAVGYKFDVRGPWSEAEGILGEDALHRASARPEHVDLDTRFANSSGSSCGDYRVRFVGAAFGRNRFVLSYAVDNSDIEMLLRLITSCAEP